MSRRFEDKVVIVTGATRGTGATIARRFAAEGAAIVGTGRSADLGEQNARYIRESGGKAIFCAADITVEDAVRAVIDAAVSEFGRLDVLVNNAAPVDLMATCEHKIADQSAAEFDLIVKSTLYGAVHAMRAGIPRMLEGSGGSIVNISSLVASVGCAGLPAYTCGKAALHGLTRQVALDYGAQGIRCNTVVAGSITQPGENTAVMEHPVLRRAIADMVLTADGRDGSPDDIAEACLYLASDQARYVNGVMLPVDGGVTSRSFFPDFAAIYAELNEPGSETSSPIGPS